MADTTVTDRWERDRQRPSGPAREPALCDEAWHVADCGGRQLSMAC
ncbi:MAG TPA: hypothetical protein VIJ23_10990 [Mycobacterium sp.]